MTHWGMLICLQWELLWVHWTKGSSKGIVNNQPKADIPLLDCKNSEINPTCITPPLSLWQPPCKDRLLLLPVITSVSFSSRAHKQLPFPSFASHFRLMNTQNLQLASVGDSCWVLRVVENKSPHLAPKYGFRRLTLDSDFFFFFLTWHSTKIHPWGELIFLPSKRSKTTSPRSYSRMTRISMPQILCAITRKLFCFLNVT